MLVGARRLGLYEIPSLVGISSQWIHNIWKHILNTKTFLQDRMCNCLYLTENVMVWCIQWMVFALSEKSTAIS